MALVTLSKDNVLMRDTYVNSSNPTNTYDTAPILYTGKWSTTGETRALLYFDIGLIPNDAIINSATLNLYLESTDNASAGPTITVHRITGTWTNPSWNTKPNYDGTAMGSFRTTATGAYSVEITQLVKMWVDGTENYGLLLYNNPSQGVSTGFSSTKISDTTRRPTLTIDYTIPTTGKKQVQYIGSGTSASATSAPSSVTPPIHSSARAGDLLVAQLCNYAAPVSAPSGWEEASYTRINSVDYRLYTKVHSGNETNPTFSSTSAQNMSAKISVFRNVKSIRELKTGSQQLAASVFSPGNASTAYEKTMFLIFNTAEYGDSVITGPLSYWQYYDQKVGTRRLQMIYRYMHTLKSQTSSEMESRLSPYSAGTSTLMVLEPITNNTPTLTLTSPSNNQTVSGVTGRRTIAISGTVIDTNDDSVTISASINGKLKTTNVAASSTAKSWTLTWDVVNDNIAQGSYSNIIVTADDGNGGTVTAIYTGAITVDKTNPVITVTGVTNGGVYQNSVSPTFSATDAGGSALSSVTATLNGASYSSGTVITSPGSNTLVVTATDNAGNQAQRTVTFTINKSPIILLSSPVGDNLLGTDGNCEDTSKFVAEGGTLALDNTRKTQGNRSIRVTKSATSTYLSPQPERYVKPEVDQYYIGISDLLQDAASTQAYVGYVYSGVGITSKNVTPVSGGFPAATVGQFIPVIRAFQVTSVNAPGTSWFYPRISHISNSTVGSFNIDAFRFYRITKVQYDALGTNVDLTTARQIANQYLYVDPTTNQTLSEGSSYLVEGSATDADAGNVVTVKYQINNGPVRALQSGVSDGSTPISFARTLAYRNKRVWDGSTDVAGADLAENTDHFLKVWAEDDQGGKSAEVTRKFRVIWNRPPVISGENGDLGILEVPPTVSYNVTDPEGNPFTVTEKINGQTIRSFPGVSGRAETLEIPFDTWIRLEPGVIQTLSIEATDNQGAKSVRTYTLTRFENEISFQIESPWPTDVVAKRVLLTLDMTLPAGADLVAEACNNAFDTNPAWEDISFYARYGRGYVFQNTQKTADQWGVSIRVRIQKGTATEPVEVKGFGGAFD